MTGKLGNVRVDEIMVVLRSQEESLVHISSWDATYGSSGLGEPREIEQGAAPPDERQPGDSRAVGTVVRGGVEVGERLTEQRISSQGCSIQDLTPHNAAEGHARTEVLREQRLNVPHQREHLSHAGRRIGSVVLERLDGEQRVDASLAQRAEGICRRTLGQSALIVRESRSIRRRQLISYEPALPGLEHHAEREVGEGAVVADHRAGGIRQVAWLSDVGRLHRGEVGTSPPDENLTSNDQCQQPGPVPAHGVRLIPFCRPVIGLASITRGRAEAASTCSAGALRCRCKRRPRTRW